MSLARPARLLPVRAARSAFVAASLAGAALVACSSDTDTAADAESEDEIRAAYPDHADVLPEAYLARPNALTFKLAQNYPKRLPVVDPSKLPWADIDFRTQPDEYLFAVRQYVFSGLGVFDGRGTISATWPGHFNDVGRRGWFGVPWLHVGNNPREGVHGLTREVDAKAKSLAPTQTEDVQSWGVGFYNARGGFALGRVWKDAANPNPAGAAFPEGTVVVKMLFSTASDAQVPWMRDSFGWEANVNETLKRDKKKVLQVVRHMQMDIGVKDTRAGKTRWVLGTFAYDADASEADARGSSPWHKMMPVGVTWGNDEGVALVNGGPSRPLEETKLARLVPKHAAATMGYAGRLNGPADNPRSACMGCHSAAQHQADRSRPLSPMVYPPFTTAEAKQRWFRSLAGANFEQGVPAEAFDEGQMGVDYSLQTAIALKNYFKSGFAEGQ